MQYSFTPPGHIPKCSFITWLAIQDRLSIENRLVLFGIKANSQCSLCHGIASGVFADTIGVSSISPTILSVSFQFRIVAATDPIQFSQSWTDSSSFAAG
ncbi:hypothetical protein RHMOL_Rhmol05G0153200 [Rhododendron molle]|uniref:Uncharacterized protein n=1 Tax=Rhododendron molle TaxID=49168 RepID=A0ACC0NPI5_RHOML|nr:hypothetical protein RHMOL_Rhmol05G0153200 [Rhododendron molle]